MKIRDSSVEASELARPFFEREGSVLETTNRIERGDHCAACRQISPIVHEVAEERSDSLKIVKIHVAENAATSALFGVRAKPTVLVFDGGAVHGQLVGARSKSEFAALVDRLR